VDDQRNERHDQEEVNQPTRDVECPQPRTHATAKTMNRIINMRISFSSDPSRTTLTLVDAIPRA